MTGLATILCFAGIHQGDAASAEDRLRLPLGRERASFGDKRNAGRSKYVDTAQFGGTYIYFPAGRSDVRFYLVRTNDSRPGAVGARLNRQSKRGNPISLDWMIELRNPRPGAGSRRV